MNKRVACSWSGGKDSCYAFRKIINQGYTPAVLVNMMNENGKISRSHGLPLTILEAQARVMHLPMVTRATSWNEYEQNFIEALAFIRNHHGIEAMVFGDIDLQAHRDWEEKVCEKAGIQALLPIWQENRKALVEQMLEDGMETMIVSCNMTMGEEFIGKRLSTQLILRLEERGIDPCGENGEFHTVVTDCPLFETNVLLPEFSPVLYEGYWFADWLAP